MHVFAVCVFDLLMSKYLYVSDLEALRAMHFRLGAPNVHFFFFKEDIFVPAL